MADIEWTNTMMKLVNKINIGTYLENRKEAINNFTEPNHNVTNVTEESSSEALKQLSGLGPGEEPIHNVVNVMEESSSEALKQLSCWFLRQKDLISFCIIIVSTYAWTKCDEFENAFKSEAHGEGEVHIAEDVSEK